MPFAHQQTFIPDVIAYATGGSVSFYFVGNQQYALHTFTPFPLYGNAESETQSFVVNQNIDATYLIVAGGGGGGSAAVGPVTTPPTGCGGGGGNGGIVMTLVSGQIVIPTASLTPGSYPVTIGRGGQRGLNLGLQNGRPGGNSSFLGSTAVGGSGGLNPTNTLAAQNGKGGAKAASFDLAGSGGGGGIAPTNLLGGGGAGVLSPGGDAVQPNTPGAGGIGYTTTIFGGARTATTNLSAGGQGGQPDQTVIFQPTVAGSGGWGGSCDKFSTQSDPSGSNGAPGTVFISYPVRYRW